MQKVIRRVIIGILAIAVAYQFVCISKLGREVKNFFNVVYETIEPKPNFEKYKNATIEIKVGKAGGAGVICQIDDNFLYVLTADHIVKRSGKVDVQVRDKNGEKVRISNISRENIYQDKGVDLAMIKIPKPEGEFEYLPISERPVEIGDKIYTIGHPLNFHYTITDGIVSNESVARKHNNKKIQYLMISSPSFAGNSGGAVVNSRGELIGIVVGIMYVDKPEGFMGKNTVFIFHMTFAVQIEDMNRLIQEVK